MLIEPFIRPQSVGLSATTLVIVGDTGSVSTTGLLPYITAQLPSSLRTATL